jgi:hypothetical protein
MQRGTEGAGVAALVAQGGEPGAGQRMINDEYVHGCSTYRPARRGGPRHDQVSLKDRTISS